MSSRNRKILCRIDWPHGVVTRLWDGSGPYADDDGDIWVGCGQLTGLDAIEQAINGEAYTLALSLSGVKSDVAGLAWEDYQAGHVIGGRARILLQRCDVYGKPVGPPQVRFTGDIDNIAFDDKAESDHVLSAITVECTNRFTMRRLTSDAVLSDTDQRARAAKLNPTAPPDRFCERVPLMQDKTIVWPRWN